MTQNAWCPICRTRQPIVDEWTDDSGDSLVRVEVYAITALECGHTVEVTSDGGPSPLQQDHNLPRAYTLPDDPYAGD